MQYQNKYDLFPSLTNSNNSCFHFDEPLRDQFVDEENYFNQQFKQPVANDGFLSNPQQSCHYNNQSQQDSLLTLTQTLINGDQSTRKYAHYYNNYNGVNHLLSSEADFDKIYAETLFGSNSSDLLSSDDSCPIQQPKGNQYQQDNQYSHELDIHSQEESIEPDVDSSPNPSDYRELILQNSEQLTSINLKQNLLDQKQKAQKIPKPLKAKANPKKNKSIIKDKMQRQNPNNHTQVQQKKNKSPKLKLDQGFKSLLRGLRKSLFSAFEKSGFSNGFHHFTDERWIAESKAFLQGYGLMQPTDRQICALSVLLYHTLGTTIKSKERPDLPLIEGKIQKEIFLEKKDNQFHRVLGEEGMLLYKIIFDKNRTETVHQFLNDDFIRGLWPLFIQFSDEQFYFKEEVEQEKPSKKTKAIKKNDENKKPKRPRSEVLNDLSPTLQHISWLLVNEYKLEVPAFWFEKFPPAYMKKKDNKKTKTY
ncbi:UNKNOWN [Stylonychia lemnae]|uniref:Uncharacterized protein n=1 Tax=Stylonychia lemnae TaxID=5949 RepID=A0A078A9Y0_STYLE|nr:UNKNOWN [Stylonychia lemnae]|eukprot:CDW79075.1 UNKNOWN [Stylonychia lemnae]